MCQGDAKQSVARILTQGGQNDDIEPVEANILQLPWITPPKCKDTECVMSRHDDLSEFKSIGDSDNALALPRVRWEGAIVCIWTKSNSVRCNPRDGTRYVQVCTVSTPKSPQLNK